jgi:hypothetical protein
MCAISRYLYPPLYLPEIDDSDSLHTLQWKTLIRCRVSVTCDPLKAVKTNHGTAFIEEISTVLRSTIRMSPICLDNLQKTPDGCFSDYAWLYKRPISIGPRGKVEAGFGIVLTLRQHKVFSYKSQTLTDTHNYVDCCE